MTNNDGYPGFRAPGEDRNPASDPIQAPPPQTASSSSRAPGLGYPPPAHTSPDPAHTSPAPAAASSASADTWPAPVGAPAGPEPAPTPTPRPERRRGGAGRLVALALVASLVGGGVGSAATLAAQDGTVTVDQTGETTPLVRNESGDAVDWTAVANAVEPAVVSITVSDGTSGSEGSGVIMDNAGHVLTNHHVVSGGERGDIMVTLHDNTIYRAEIVGSDVGSDVAVIRIIDPPAELTPITFGDVDQLRVGDPVMAVGNPLGLSGSVTTGIISALHRPVQSSSSSQQEPSPWGQNQTSEETVVTDAIQTSAPINPGNSGGALVSASGQLIGITSSIATLGSGDSTGGNIGIGFAIPADQARAVAADLIDDGQASTAVLGVTTSDGIGQVDGQDVVGARVESVEPDSAAAAAGLQTGDVITAMDEVPVTGSVSLAARVRGEQVGTEISLKVSRQGQDRTVTTTLGAR